jgi:hypothetical protein
MQVSRIKRNCSKLNNWLRRKSSSEVLNVFFFVFCVN